MVKDSNCKSQEFLVGQAVSFLEGLEAGQCENTEELEALREMVRMLSAFLEQAPMLELTVSSGIASNDES